MFGHVPISSLRLNASLYLNNISITLIFSQSYLNMNYLDKCTFLIFLCLSCTFFHHLDITMDICLSVISVLFPFQCIYKVIKVPAELLCFLEPTISAQALL